MFQTLLQYTALCKVFCAWIVHMYCDGTLVAAVLLSLPLRQYSGAHIRYNAKPGASEGLSYPHLAAESRRCAEVLRGIEHVELVLVRRRKLVVKGTLKNSVTAEWYTPDQTTDAHRKPGAHLYRPAAKRKKPGAFLASHGCKSTWHHTGARAKYHVAHASCPSQTASSSTSFDLATCRSVLA